DRQIPIRVLLENSARSDLDMLKNLKVGTATGNPVPLASVADISFGSAESRVERLNRMRMIEVQANLDNNATLGTALAAIAA
ncbi:efflux RND transporter permease subunit, partial [Ochrobactrum sp. MR31]|nr:efflux RND transporter permease subunit [Ochrobactrum sp. MR31]